MMTMESDNLDKIIQALENAITAKENHKYYPWLKAEMSFEFITVLIDLLKEVQKEKERNPVIVCPHCGKRVK
jgi:hypothetical protein